MANPLEISHYLPADYTLPYGTNLTLADFVLEPQYHHLPRWQITAKNDLEIPVTYSVAMTGRGDNAYAMIAGERILCRNINSKELYRLAPLANWVDFILWQDAQAYLNHLQPEYEGDDIDSMLYRLEHGIVRKGNVEENTNNFHGDINALQTWVTAQLRNSTLAAKAFEIHNFHNTKEFVQKLDEPGFFESKSGFGAMTVPMLNHHEHPWEIDESKRIEDTQLFYGFHTFLDADWFNWICGEIHSVEYISVRMDGQRVEQYCAVHVFDLTILESMAKLEYAGEVPQISHNVQAIPNQIQFTVPHIKTNTSITWWGIHVAGTKVALIFPARGTNLVIDTDMDGSIIGFLAAPTERRTERNNRLDRMERDWGRWLDPNVTLSPAELAKGTSVAEAMMDT